MLSVGGDNTPPTELYNLRPDRIKIRSGSRAMPVAYDYMLKGQVVESYGVDQATGGSKVKHIKLFNPFFLICYCIAKKFSNKTVITFISVEF